MPSLMSPELPTLRRNTSITPRKAAYRAPCRLPCTTRDNHRLIRGKPSLRHLSIKGDDIPRVDYFTVKNPCHVIIFRLAGIAFVLHHSSRSPLMPAARGNQRIILTSPLHAASPGCSETQTARSGLSRTRGHARGFSARPSAEAHHPPGLSVQKPEMPQPAPSDAFITFSCPEQEQSVIPASVSAMQHRICPSAIPDRNSSCLTLQRLPGVTVT